MFDDEVGFLGISFYSVMLPLITCLNSSVDLHPFFCWLVVLMVLLLCYRDISASFPLLKARANTFLLAFLWYYPGGSQRGGGQKEAGPWQSRFVIFVIDRILGPSQLVWHNRQCPCLFDVLEATHKPRMRALEGHRVSSQRFATFRDQGKDVAARNRKEYCFPLMGSLICAPGKWIIFTRQAPW